MKTHSARTKEMSSNKSIGDIMGAVFLGLVVTAIFVIAMVLNSFINYVIYSNLVNVVDPSTIYWYDWFLWSNNVTDAALWHFFPTIWWIVTLVVSAVIDAMFSIAIYGYLSSR